ncbi:MAG: hypothetical protein H7Y42_16740 [Chitinophagaceae bacterium]|nr:hypothetical protein [Chitinophagaceae bacterium]
MIEINQIYSISTLRVATKRTPLQKQTNVPPNPILKRIVPTIANTLIDAGLALQQWNLPPQPESYIKGRDHDCL